jgi:hypothetical protein
MSQLFALIKFLEFWFSNNNSRRFIFGEFMLCLLLVTFVSKEILRLIVAVYWLTRRNIHEELSFHQRR